MKKILNTGILLFFAVVSCKSNKSNLKNRSTNLINDTTIAKSVDAITIQKNQETEKEMVLNIDSILKKHVNIKINYQDSLVYVSGNRGFYDTDNGQIVAFTKLKDNNELFAVVYPITFDDDKQPEVMFYILKDDKWELVSKFYSGEINYFEIIDLDNDNVREIQTIGYPNMNGNYSNNFYSYSEKENKFIDGGGFFSSIYEIKPQLNRVEVEYGGSWYMANTKTIYYWKNHKLIPFKEVEVGLKIADMRHNAQYFKYSENLSLNKDSLQLKYKKSYRGEKLHHIFEYFFENN